MKTAIATRNTVRVPYRSATHPLAGMNTATDSRYDVSATFMCTGSAPNALAIVGSAVAITVEFEVLHEQRAGHDDRRLAGAPAGSNRA